MHSEEGLHRLKQGVPTIVTCCLDYIVMIRPGILMFVQIIEEV